MRKFVWIVGSLIAFLILAALIAPFFINVNSYKGLIANQVKQATGRDLMIEGDLSLSIIGGPAIQAKGIKLSNLPNSSDPNMVSLDDLKVSLALAPLLSGDIQVTDITLVKPVILLEKWPDGRDNWQFQANNNSNSSPSPQPTPESSAGSNPAIKFDSITIEDGKLIYRDHGSNSEEIIENINAEASLDSLKGPYQLDGGLSYGGRNISLHIKSGKMEANAPVPIDATISTEDNEGKVTYAGTLSLSPLSVTGRISGEAENLNKLLRAMNSGAASPLPALDQAMRFSADIKNIDKQQIQITNGQLSLGDTNATLAANIAYGTTPIGLGIRIDMNQIDLNQFLPSETTENKKKGGETSGGGKTAKFSLPSGIAVNGAVTIKQILYKEKTIGQFEFAGNLANQKLTLDRLSALLPGNSAIKISGNVTAPQGVAQFSGNAGMKGDNLRALLQSFDINLDQIPSDRLRKFTLDSQVLYRPNLIQIANLKGQLDTSRLSGGANIALPEAGKKIGLGLSLSVDALNVDAYLPKDNKTGNSDQSGQKKAASDDPLKALAPLAGLNANADFSAGSLIINQQQISNLKLQASIEGNNILIKNASVGEFLGGDGQVSGKIESIHAEPSFALNFDIGAKDGGALFAMAKQDRMIGQSLGAVRANGTASGTSRAISYDTKISMSNLRGTGAAKGKVSIADPMTTDNTISINLQEPSPLLQALGIAKAGGGRLGALALAGSVKTSPEQTGLDLTLSGLDGQTAIKGNIASGDIDVALTANYPQFATILKALNLPVNNNANGPLQASAHMRGNADGANIENLQMKWGGSDLAGTIQYAKKNERMSVNADLQGGTIDLSPFMAKNNAKSGGNSANSKGAPWSKEPFDFSALEKWDANLSLSANQLILPEYRLEKFNLKSQLAKGFMTLSALNGGLYGGQFSLDGTKLTFGRNDLALDTQVKIDRLMIENVMKGGVAGMGVRGPLSLNLQAKGQGTNQATLIQSLNGNGNFHGQVTLLGQVETAVGATLLNILGQKVKQLRSTTDTLNTALTSFVGMANNAEGNFTIENGIAHTEDSQFNNPRAFGRAQGDINLAAWLMDMNVHLYQNNQSQPFFSIALNGPIDSPKPTITDRNVGASAPGGTAPQPSGPAGILQQLIPGLGGKRQPPANNTQPVPLPSSPAPTNPAANPEPLPSEPGAPGTFGTPSPSAPETPLQTPQVQPAPVEPTPQPTNPPPPQPSPQAAPPVQQVPLPGAAPASEPNLQPPAEPAPTIPSAEPQPLPPPEPQSAPENPAAPVPGAEPGSTPP